jgi:hypothetical protein
MVFVSGLLVYGIGAFKCYLNIRMFEKVSDFPDLGNVVSKVDPLLLWLLMFLAWVLVCVFYFSFLMRDMGNPLLSAMVRYFCHSVFSFSGVNGKDIILLIK